MEVPQFCVAGDAYGGVYGDGAVDGFFRGFSAFFALLRVVPELSASFRSPRWRRVLCHRDLRCTIHRTLLT